jgi:hypothetical protein
VPKSAKNLPAVIQVHAGHLKAVATDRTDRRLTPDGQREISDHID